MQDVSGNASTQTVSFMKRTMRAYSHDGDGNRVTNAGGGVTNVYVYNPENRLLRVEGNGVVVLVREARLANTPQAVRKRAVGMDRLRQTVQDRGGAESASCKQWAGLEGQ